MPPLPSPSWFDNPWVAFLLPLVVFLVVGSFEPLPPDGAAQPGTNKSWFDLGVRYEHYPWIYSLKILFTVCAIVAVARGYPPRRAIHPLAIVVGVVGVAVWVALAHFQRWLVAALNIEQVTSWLGGHRPGFNPLEQMGHTPEGYLFLVVRFVGLAAIVPVIEEMFLRGFLMRYFKQHDWWNVAIGTPDRWGIVAAIVIPVLMHPQEALAAIVWFGVLAWLVIRTKNVWDCVVAHAVTNLLLGIYVVASGEWWLM